MLDVVVFGSANI